MSTTPVDLSRFRDLRRRQAVLRTGRPISQEELARALGCGQHSYFKWERGERGLPWGLTASDVEAVIERILADRDATADRRS